MEEPKTSHSEVAAEAAVSATGGSAPTTVEGLSLDGDTLAQVQELLRNAEAEGYLRGRNEKIEATQHFEQDDEPEPEPAPFPTYARRSVWDAD